MCQVVAVRSHPLCCVGSPSIPRSPPLPEYASGRFPPGRPRCGQRGVFLLGFYPSIPEERRTVPFGPFPRRMRFLFSPCRRTEDGCGAEQRPFRLRGENRYFGSSARQTSGPPPIPSPEHRGSNAPIKPDEISSDTNGRDKRNPARRTRRLPLRLTQVRNGSSNPILPHFPPWNGIINDFATIGQYGTSERDPLYISCIPIFFQYFRKKFSLFLG